MTASRFTALCLGLCIAGSAQAATGYHVIDRISGPDGGWDYVRVDAKNNRVLLTHGSSVMAIDLATKAVSSFAPGQRLHDAMPVNGGAEVLVTNGGTNSVVFADAKTGAAVATVEAGKGPDSAAFEPKTGLALVMDHAGIMTLIDPKAHKVVGTINVGGALEAAAADGSGRVFVNVENKNEMVAVDIAQRKVLAHWPLAGCDGSPLSSESGSPKTVRLTPSASLIASSRKERWSVAQGPSSVKKDQPSPGLGNGCSARFSIDGGVPKRVRPNSGVMKKTTATTRADRCLPWRGR